MEESEAAPSPRWAAVLNRKPETITFPPDTSDDVVYIDECLAFLLDTYGPASSPTGVKGYALDNEPALWFYTHPRLFTQPLTVFELLTRSIDLSHTVKDLDPAAETFGPCLYGFTAYLNLQDAPDWDEYSGTYNRFVEAYLDLMRAASDTAGVRLLDVLDVHWYPEPDGVYAGDTSRAVAEIRLQVTRSLWDSTYVEPSWIGQWFSPVAILPYLQGAIDAYYPGTKLAITEYDYGAPHHISGGLAQADALGIFGRYGVYFGSKWGPHSAYIRSAYRLYLDCDGNGTAFGNQAVSASTSDIENCPVYAARSGNGALHIVLINRSYDEPITGHVSIIGDMDLARGGSWGFSRSDTLLQPGAAIDIGPDHTFDVGLPPLSAHHLILRPETGAAGEPVGEDVSLVTIEPNPARGVIHVRYRDGVDAAGYVAIHDVTGKLVREVYNRRGARSLTIERLGLESGTYFLRIRAGDRATTRKVLWTR